MPRREDIHKILIIGSGPIVIGQACEFDYSGTQAVKALKEEGYEVVLVNSNPATIMTDPEFADRTYVEPITPAVIERIIEREKPDALLPTLGGQTALNNAMALAESGALERHGVEMIGARPEAIDKAENREKFARAMKNCGLSMPRGGFAHNMDEAMKILDEVGLPAIIRPSFTLGGTGGNVAYNLEEFKSAAQWGIDQSPTNEVLIEQSILGWKEFELEVMRDHADNVVIICSIENFDPMGVHTGDSITVAPIQTLTDREYQRLRDASLAIIREIGVDTGGSNIQFATNPENGEMTVIEMNPRVSRSSALASKATGFPIAKIAAKLAVGYTLDEIPNDITRETPSCFEPTIDYVVTKIPRFTFEKFPAAGKILTTQMKSVGEVMAIGRTFKESLQKALRSLEIDRCGFDNRLPTDAAGRSVKADKNQYDLIRSRITQPYPNRIWYIAEAFRQGIGLDEVHEMCRIDPWFLYHIREIVTEEERLISIGPKSMQPEDFTRAKRMGFSDRRMAALLHAPEIARARESGPQGNKEATAILEAREAELRETRLGHGVRAVYKRVDTCGAEFEAHTPYMYSTYEQESEVEPTDRKKVMILGGGPNRIGQGIEFDYCCVHASFALQDAGYEVIMVNCNPETVSTDYDTSDRLYFEPLTLEDILGIYEAERPLGAIVQFGGQTPLRLAVPLEKAGVPILGTPSDAIDRTEDRERFNDLLAKLDLKKPDNGLANSFDESLRIAEEIGYPVMVRPSYVLGGRAMEIVYNRETLEEYMRQALKFGRGPILIDRYLQDAIELDVDALCDGERVVIGGIMEHIEEAGVHSGDSACCLPPHSLDAEIIEKIKVETRALGKEIGTIGLMNIQYAVQDGEIYVIEVNPRASRTVPFVSKAIGVPLAKVAARIQLGETLEQIGFTEEIVPEHLSVKESVFPFNKFPGVDTLLGPEMKSTGEVMGIDHSFPVAFGKAQQAAIGALPLEGNVFVSVKDNHKPRILEPVKRLIAAGFGIVATGGTCMYLREQGIEVERVNKVHEARPDVVDQIKDGRIQLVFNTTAGAAAIADSFTIRRETLHAGIPYFTTVRAIDAVSQAIAARVKEPFPVRCLQEYHNIGK